MTRFVADDSPPSRMRIARNAAELVLFGIREIPIVFDREGVASSIRLAIASIYRALDAGPDSLVQPEALSQAATLLGAARETLLGSAKRKTFQIERAAGVLADARTHALAACEAVAFDQMNRRMELPWGREEDSSRLEPFRASLGEPQLFALPRDVVEPFIELGEAEPEPSKEVDVALAKPPANLDELRAMAQDLFAAANDVEREEPENEPASDEGVPTTREPSLEDPANDAELRMLAEIARDAIEDIASLGSLRHPIETESWLDQAPFEQRLLNRLDHFCSLGHNALRAAVLYHAESDTPDEARAFALAFTLGCVRGFDSVDAVVTTIRQSPPEIYPGFVEGLVLATNPRVEEAMRTLLGHNDVKLVGLALEVLSQRRCLNDEDLQTAVEIDEPRLQWLVAKSLGTNLEREQALIRLERIYATAQPGSEIHLAALESGIRRCHPEARHELRRLLQSPRSEPHTARAAALLGLCGSARDFELLAGAVQSRPSPLILEGLGRHGHVGAIPSLLQIIDEQDDAWAPVAVKELERITGAGLFEQVEEPWVTELPPEAADMDVAIPMKQVRRITRDPERWHDWQRQRGDAFEPTKKYRRGLPFTPTLILQELAAVEPRSDERERSALELCAATGCEFGFRASDWVAAQQRALARISEHLERHAFEAGSWCFAGASVAARPEPRPEPRPDPFSAVPTYLARPQGIPPSVSPSPPPREAVAPPALPPIMASLPVRDPLSAVPAPPPIAASPPAPPPIAASPPAPPIAAPSRVPSPPAPVGFVAPAPIVTPDAVTASDSRQMPQTRTAPIESSAGVKPVFVPRVTPGKPAFVPPVVAPTPVPPSPSKLHGVVPDFLYEAHFAEPPKKPMRFLSPDTPVGNAASRAHPPTPDVPIAAPKPPPAPIEPPRVSRDVQDKKPVAPPPTYFDPNARSAPDPKHPLKKLPWEK